MLESISINTELFFHNALKNLIIDEDRQNTLNSIAKSIVKQLQYQNPVNLNFICTHNSRRSQLAQVWGNYAAHFYKIKNIQTFSGGTAITAFYRNTIKTLQEVGFQVQISVFSHQNPEYYISYEHCTNPIIGFSKLYDNEYNKKPFIAIMTCSNAEINCPIISDSLDQFNLPFNDPKNFDNSLYQAEKYLETNKQIAGEIHYIFTIIKDSK